MSYFYSFYSIVNAYISLFHLKTLLYVIYFSLNCRQVLNMCTILGCSLNIPCMCDIIQLYFHFDRKPYRVWPVILVSIRCCPDSVLLFLRGYVQINLLRDINSLIFILFFFHSFLDNHISLSKRLKKNPINNEFDV